MPSSPFAPSQSGSADTPTLFLLLCDYYVLKGAFVFAPSPPPPRPPARRTASAAALICSPCPSLCTVCWLLRRENIFWCCTHAVVTVIGKDHGSLSSRWTFNEALFMLQPLRERAEKCQAGPSRRAVWG